MDISQIPKDTNFSLFESVHIKYFNNYGYI